VLFKPKNQDQALKELATMLFDDIVEPTNYVLDLNKEKCDFTLESLSEIET